MTIEHEAYSAKNSNIISHETLKSLSKQDSKYRLLYKILDNICAASAHGDFQITYCLDTSNNIQDELMNLTSFVFPELEKLGYRIILSVKIGHYPLEWISPHKAELKSFGYSVYTISWSDDALDFTSSR